MDLTTGLIGLATALLAGEKGFSFLKVRVDKSKSNGNGSGNGKPSGVTSEQVKDVIRDSHEHGMQEIKDMLEAQFKPIEGGLSRIESATNETAKGVTRLVTLQETVLARDIALLPRRRARKKVPSA